MREIKFRGKRIDNDEWVYGDLIKNNNKYYIITTVGYVSDENLDFANKYLECFAYEVIPETVGQYTGLKDKNNKEIYEDDIYDIGMCTKIIRKNNFIEDSYELINMINDKGSIKVIGNIYDNPELLN